MPTRQTLPTTWLMTDERLGDRLWTAIERLPAGGGVVLRHHRSDEAMGLRVARSCSERGLLLAVAGDGALARRLGAAMVHNPQGVVDAMLVSRSIHGAGDGRTVGEADLVFVSPIFATASHPGAEALGLERGLELAMMCGVPAIALGGMTRERGKAAIRAGFHGWAAIDAWTSDAFLRS